MHMYAPMYSTYIVQHYRSRAFFRMKIVMKINFCSLEKISSFHQISRSEESIMSEEGQDAKEGTKKCLVNESLTTEDQVLIDLVFEN